MKISKKTLLLGAVLFTGIILAGCSNGNNNNSSSGGINIIKCYNQGNISAKAGYGGGIIGSTWINGIIDQCYNSGNIVARYSAGIIARMYGDKKYPTKVTNCFNTGIISGESNSGGIIGVICFGDNDVVRDCYNLGEIICNRNKRRNYWIIL